MYKNFVCVTDRKISCAPFLQQIETICALRPKALILREKDLTDAEYMQLARKVQAVCKTCGVKFIVHTFWRAGLALGADGAHLPLPVCAAMTAAERLQAGCFGVSVHSAEGSKGGACFGRGIFNSRAYLRKQLQTGRAAAWVSVFKGNLRFKPGACLCYWRYWF